MKNVLFLLTATVVLTLCSCSSKSLEDKFNKKTFKQDVLALSEKKLLTEGDKELITTYVTSNEKDSLALSKSYSEILTTAKKEKEFTDKLEKEKAEKKKKINDALNVSVTRKYTQNFFDQGYIKTFLLVDIIAKNNTDKKLSGFTVRINFKSADGNIFYSPEWPVAKVIKANSKITIPLSTGEFKNTNVDQARLKMADLSKIKIEYEVSQLMYDDGTSLSIK